jgi:DNA-binding MarR family transcriptional regulator
MSQRYHRRDRRPGYVERSAHPSDRRATLIELSPRGDALARQFDAHAAAVVGRFETLSVADQRHLTRILEQLFEAMDRDA